MPVSQPVSETSPARRLARLSSELRVSGLGQFALGLACLVVGTTSGDTEAVRVAVPFVVAFAAMAGVSLYVSRGLRGATAATAPQDARVEDASVTTRRSLLKLAVGLFLVGVATSLGPATAAVFGGLLAGVGAVQLRDYQWLTAREKASGQELHREVGLPPFRGSRTLYTLPMKPSTLAT